MRNILKVTCWIFALICIYFPFSYFNSSADKKEIKVSHILVDTKQEAEEIKKESENTSFEDLAKKYSQCPSKEDGGNLGYNQRDRLLPEFTEVAYKQKKLKVSEPFETSVGWHLAKVYDIKYFSDKENFSRRYSISKDDINNLLNK